MNAQSRLNPPQPRPNAPDASAAAAAPAASGPPPESVARLVPLDPGFYAFSLAAETRWRDPVAGFAVPAVHIGTPPDRDDLEITDSSGHAGAWLGGRQKMLFVKAPRGGIALLTAYLGRDLDEKPLDVEIRRVSPGGAAAPGSPGWAGGPWPPIATLRMGGSVSPHGSMQPVGHEIVAHVRGRGDLRFSDSAWAGRLGRGQSIEAFTIAPRDRSAAAAIEYKGLTASGEETPWVACGSPCGTRGRSLPLLGFAIRQKADPGGARFDCEYAGYFQSGATAGPCRNGAPCRSPHDNDPLEGMQLRITPRPQRPAAAPPS